jgi:hypothetical protein
MSRFQKNIRVVSNPFSSLDHKARPCGIVLLEPESGYASSGYIGARISRATTVTVAPSGDLRGNRQDTVFDFDATPVEVKATPYYLGFLRSGALLPADEKSAAVAGVKFRPVAEAMAATKAAAAAEFDRLYGEGSFAELTTGSEAAPQPTTAPAHEETAPMKTRKADK